MDQGQNQGHLCPGEGRGQGHQGRLPTYSHKRFCIVVAAGLRMIRSIFGRIRIQQIRILKPDPGPTCTCQESNQIKSNIFIVAQRHRQYGVNRC